MKARDRFKIGDRVRPTAAARRHFQADTFARMGPAKVVGFSVDPACVRVVRDGNVTPQNYHASFWEVDQDAVIERQIDDIKAYVARSLVIPVAILAPTIGMPERIIDPLVGTSECDSYIEDHDRGDEDPSERPRWTVHIRLLEPVRLPGVLDMVAFTGVVSV